MSGKVDYDWEVSCLGRLFLGNAFYTIKHLIPLFQSQNIVDSDLPNIKHEDESIYLAEKLYERINDGYTINQIASALFENHLSHIRTIGGFVILRTILNVVTLFCFQLIIENLISLDRMYLTIWLSVLTVAQFFRICLMHKIIYEGQVLALKIKSGLNQLLYEKVVTMSSFSANSQGVGKLCNLISNDFNPIPTSLGHGAVILFCFVDLTVIMTIMIFRLGAVSVLSFLTTVLVMLYLGVIGKVSAGVLTTINKNQDDRLKLTLELIQGIKLIKLYGWEHAFTKLIEDIRAVQIIQFIKLKLTDAFLRVGVNFAPYVLVLSAYGAVYLLGDSDNLSSSNMLAIIHPILIFGEIMWEVTHGINFYFSMKNILERFVTVMKGQVHILEPLDEQSSEKIGVKNGEIRFKNFSGFREQTSEEGLECAMKQTLHSINAHFCKGGFYGIIGRVGSGKSGLLGAILRQVPYCKGTLELSGSVAFVEQQPIIFSGTIKNNILFGLEFQQTRYEEVLHLCCLDADLDIWDKRDETKVGERGLTLSGGQKARVCLARALYSDSDIYILDDPLSAVDAKVGKQIYNNLYKWLKRNKTTILVTHQIHFLENCDTIFEMQDGRLRTISKKQLQKQVETILQQQKPALTINNQQIIPAEQEQLAVNCSTYKKYYTYHWINYLLLPLTVVLCLVYEAMMAISLRVYANFDQIKAGVMFESVEQFWIFMIVINVVAILFDYIRSILFGFCTLASNKKLHDDMVLGIIRSPLTYFDVTPTGQLINKFSNDLGILDHSVNQQMLVLINMLAMLIIIVANLIQIHIIYVLGTLLSILLVIVAANYASDSITGARYLSLQLKTPVFSHLSETISGLIPIHTYNRTNSYMHEFADRQNSSFKGEISLYQCQRFFGFFINSSITFILCTCLIYLSFNVDEKSTHLFVIQIIFVLRVGVSVFSFICDCIQSRGSMICAERAFFVAELRPEANLRTVYDEEEGLYIAEEGQRKKWPQNASIQLKNLSLRYRPELDLTLKNISLSIQDGEKIGVVGRTGAGKSSLLQALFRAVEPEQHSTYKIDGYDVLKMGLHTLRMSMCIIPQTPFLFNASIRQNIDPFESKSDEEIWTALSLAGLSPHIQNLPDKLDTEISNHSSVFSVGQKQLLCLARVLLRKRRFLILDEATSNVDNKTDSFIQQCIKKEFKDATVITIAHRLSTLADYDKILVLDKGKIVQFGSPYTLLKQGRNFAQMVDQTGSASKDIWQRAKQRHLQS